MIARRGFLLGMLAAAAAPAIVRSGVLMPVKPVIWTPPAAFVPPVGGYYQVFAHSSMYEELVRAIRPPWPAPRR